MCGAAGAWIDIGSKVIDLQKLELN